MNPNNNYQNIPNSKVNMVHPNDKAQITLKYQILPLYDNLIVLRTLPFSSGQTEFDHYLNNKFDMI